jgi:hypothetical protein
MAQFNEFINAFDNDIESDEEFIIDFAPAFVDTEEINDDMMMTIMKDIIGEPTVVVREPPVVTPKPKRKWNRKNTRSTKQNLREVGDKNGKVNFNSNVRVSKKDKKYNLQRKDIYVTCNSKYGLLIRKIIARLL